jgi:hypothetical protein
VSPSPARRSTTLFRASLSITVGSIAILGAATLVSCNELPRRRGQSVETAATAKLDEMIPVDIVVAPIENETGRKDVPLASLREAFERGLVRRRYTPLATEYVDRRVVNASYAPGSLQEEAVFQVTVESWDASLLESRGALKVKARARLLDARESTNGQLWTGSIDHRFELQGGREKFSTNQALLQYASELIAEEILAALPARSAAPGK